MKTILLILSIFILGGCELEYGSENNTLANPIPEWEPREFIRDGDYGMVDFALVKDNSNLYHIIGIDASVGHPWNPENQGPPSQDRQPTESARWEAWREKRR